MKKLNNKGFAISTLIYGVLILFILITSVLIATLIFRYNLFLDLSSKAYYYDYDINIHLYNDDKYESKYLVPYDGTYYFYEVDDSFDKIDDKTSKESIKIYLEKGQEIELSGKQLKNNEKNFYEIDDGNKLIINKISSSEILNIPNHPDLTTGLVPVKYDEDLGQWVVVRKTSQWYDYDNQKWANAVSLKDQTLNKPGQVLNLPDGEEITEEKSDVYAMFVWIPRYSYTIGCTDTDDCYGYKIDGASNVSQATPGAIDIKFVAKDKKDELKYEDEEKEKPIYPTYEYSVDSHGMPMADRDPQNWYTHPAFDFGEISLSGIWVGKFETSTDKSSTCYTTPNSNNCNNTSQSPRVLPNVSSLRYQQVYNQYITAKKFTETDNKYELTGDAHMMKNSEWAAVAYLSQSIYGKYGNSNYTEKNKEIYKNDSSSYYTGKSIGKFSETSGDYSSLGTCNYDDSSSKGDGQGLCGPGASTTGNIYGIYDMVGGAIEIMMAWYKGNETVSFGGRVGYSNNSGFVGVEVPYEREFDLYTSPDIGKKSEEVLGHAMAETNGWYSDDLIELQIRYPFVYRSGTYSGRTDKTDKEIGIFYSDVLSGTGNAKYTFRTVLLIE